MIPVVSAKQLYRKQQRHTIGNIYGGQFDITFQDSFTPPGKSLRIYYNINLQILNLFADVALYLGWQIHLKIAFFIRMGPLFIPLLHKSSG